MDNICRTISYSRRWKICKKKTFINFYIKYWVDRRNSETNTHLDSGYTSRKKKEHLSEYPEVAGRRQRRSHTATTSIAAPSTEIPSNGTIQGNNRESPVSQPTHNLPEAAISTADNGTAAADTNLITGSKKPTNKRKNKKKSRKTLPNDDEIVPTAAIATAAEDSNSMDGYEPPKPRRSNRTSQPKVPKSDAIAIQEAQKFIQQKSKRRR